MNNIIIRRLLKISIFSALFIAGMNIASAASLYGVTETTATVGVATNLEIEYTVDTAVQTWADADTLTVQLPANLPQWGSLTYTVEYDSDVTNDGTGETAIAAGAGNGEYAVSTDTLTVKWDVSTWGAVADGASTIRILVTAAAIPQYEDATSTFTFAGTTVAGGDTNPSGTDDVNVSAADAAVSIALGTNSVVAAAGNTTLTLTIPVDLAASDTVVFTMPDNLDVSSAALGSETFGGAGTFACADALQVITCTADGAITAGTATIVMTGITSKYAATSQTVTSLAVNDDSNAGADISSDASGTVTDTTAADAAASVALGTNSVVGTAGNTTLTLTIPVDLAASDTVVFTLPDNLDVSSTALGSETFAGAGTFACTDAAQVITCTADGVITAGTATIVLAGIVSEYVATSQTVTLLAVNDASASDADISSDASGTVTDTTVGDLTSTNIEPASLAANTSSVNTVTFTTTAAIPNLGKIVVVYPSGWTVAGVATETAGNLSGLDGTWTATVSGQTITFTQTGGTASSAGAKSFTIDNGVIAPGATGASGTYTITTTTATNQYIETDTIVTADTIIAGHSSDNTVPALPSNFALAVNENLEVVITWTDPSDSDLKQIMIAKSTGVDTEVSSLLTSIGKGVETYTDTAVTAGQTVNYTLMSRDTSGNQSLMTDVLSIVVLEDAAPVVAEESTEEPTTEEVTTEEVTTAEEAGTEAELIDDSVFSDIASHWAKEVIEMMAEKSIVMGDPDGAFRPDDSLNRAEAAALLYRVLGLGTAATPDEKPFSDVETDSWYSPNVAALKDLEIANGNPDGTYQPGESINRAEFLTLAMNAYYYLADADTKASIDELKGTSTNTYSDLESDWYSATVTASTELGFVGGYDCDDGKCFGAENEITRAEATKILYNMFYDILT